MREFSSASSSEILKPTTLDTGSFDPDKRVDVNRQIERGYSEGYDVDKRVDVSEKEVKGGAYSEVKKNSNGEKHEVHHMPADSASYLERGDGPAIKMDKCDHRQTASCGHSRESIEYCKIQKELIEQGKFREALQMDIDDIRDKFGSKYDDAISEMLEYVDKLEMEGKIQ